MTIKLPVLLLALASVSAHAQTAPRPAAAAAGKAPAAAANDAVTPERMFAEWDTDRNTQLSLTEFKTGIEKARIADFTARLEQQFRRSDLNSNKKLEAGEYAAIPAIKRGGTAAPPFATFDTNKDQGIDLQEYLAMVRAFMRNSGAGQ